jgi:PilZ domain
MNKSNNVIDLKSRRPVSGRSPAVVGNDTAAGVVDMTERRNQILGEERRQVRRTILTEFVGAFIVVPERGLQKVALYDISDNGLGFDLDLADGALRVGEEIAMRVYLNHQTYFGFIARVSNERMVEEEGVYRHGVSFVKGTVNDEALHHFVKFIETVSASLQTDHGDVMVSGLTR